MEILQTHDQLQYHKDAAAKAQALISTINNPERSIQHFVSEQASERYQNNFCILSKIVRAVLFCGRQNISEGSSR